MRVISSPTLTLSCNQLETNPGGASGTSAGAGTHLTVISKVWGREGVEEIE